MRQAAGLLALAAALAGPPALAGGFELEAGVGASFPRYEQSLSWDPATYVPPTPGVTLSASGPLDLEAQGGLAWHGGLTWYFLGGLGLEARYDSVTADLVASGASYDVRVVAVPGVPSFNARLQLGAEDLQLDSVHPVSLNLRFRTPGPVRLVLSGGVSYLDAIQVQGALVGTLSSSLPVPLPTVRVNLAAVAPPGEDDGQFGVNAGLGLQIGLGQTLSLQGEVRAFAFKERTLTWSALGVPANAVEQALQRELLGRLEPIQFDPLLWSATAGVSLTF